MSEVAREGVGEEREKREGKNKLALSVWVWAV
jgi:hypothetical protein